MSSLYAIFLLSRLPRSRFCGSLSRITACESRLLAPARPGPGMVRTRKNVDLDSPYFPPVFSPRSRDMRAEALTVRRSSFGRSACGRERPASQRGGTRAFLSPPQRRRDDGRAPGGSARRIGPCPRPARRNPFALGARYSSRPYAACGPASKLRRPAQLDLDPRHRERRLGLLRPVQATLRITMS